MNNKVKVMLTILVSITLAIFFLPKILECDNYGYWVGGKYCDCIGKELVIYDEVYIDGSRLSLCIGKKENIRIDERSIY